jgi:uncharacterized protein YfiM (DUF2279 family)
MSNGVQSLHASPTYATDAYWELKGGSFMISRWSSNMGNDFTDSTDFGVTKIAYVARINSNEELEWVKVTTDTAGASTGSIIARLGIAMPTL